MTDSPKLPGSHSLPIDPNTGRFSTQWTGFFRDLASYMRSTDGNSEELALLEARLAALEAAGAIQFSGPFSVQVLGDGTYSFQLVGDIPAPAVQSYYGTNEAGNRGWYQRLLSTLADVDVTTPPEAGDALVYDGAVWKPGSVDTAVPFFVPDGQSYTVAANKQALFTLPIELDGDASLVLDGALVEVS